MAFTHRRRKCLRQPCPHPGQRRRRQGFRGGRTVVRSCTQGRDRKRAGGGKKSDAQTVAMASGKANVMDVVTAVAETDELSVSAVRTGPPMI